MHKTCLLRWMYSSTATAKEPSPTSRCGTFPEHPEDLKCPHTHVGGPFLTFTMTTSCACCAVAMVTTPRYASPHSIRQPCLLWKSSINGILPCVFWAWLLSVMAFCLWDSCSSWIHEISCRFSVHVDHWSLSLLKYFIVSSCIYSTFNGHLACFQFGSINLVLVSRWASAAQQASLGMKSIGHGEHGYLALVGKAQQRHQGFVPITTCLCCPTSSTNSRQGQILPNL